MCLHTVSTDAVDLPIVRFEVSRFGRPDDYVLHVSPGQIAVSFERQSADTGCQWSRSGRARMTGCARVVQICRHDLMKITITHEKRKRNKQEVRRDAAISCA